MSVMVGPLPWCRPTVTPSFFKSAVAPEGAAPTPNMRNITMTTVRTGGALSNRKARRFKPIRLEAHLSPAEYTTITAARALASLGAGRSISLSIMIRLAVADLAKRCIVASSDVTKMDELVRSLHAVREDAEAERNNPAAYAVTTEAALQQLKAAVEEHDGE